MRKPRKVGLLIRVFFYDKLQQIVITCLAVLYYYENLLSPLQSLGDLRFWRIDFFLRNLRKDAHPTVLGRNKNQCCFFSFYTL